MGKDTDLYGEGQSVLDNDYAGIQEILDNT